MIFQLVPNPLVGIVLRRIRRRREHRQTIPVLVDKILDDLRLMGIDVIPENNDLAFDVLEEMAEEFSHLRALDSLVGKLEVQLPIRGNA
jgi:hypothetical protein